MIDTKDLHDELIKSYVERNGLFSTLIEYGEILESFKHVAHGFKPETQEIFKEFIKRYADDLGAMIANSYKKENLNQN